MSGQQTHSYAIHTKGTRVSFNALVLCSENNIQPPANVEQKTEGVLVECFGQPLTQAHQTGRSLIVLESVDLEYVSGKSLPSAAGVPRSL